MKAVLSFCRASLIPHLLFAWATALLISLMLSSVDAGNEVERIIANFRADLLEKPASGDVTIIEIDAQSLQTIDDWPWPREHYAKAIDRLNEAGVTQIAFDVDFSSHSTEAQDRTFAQALKRSDATVILPTMRQQASNGRSEFVESLPIEPLRENAFLASVNVHPDDRGQLNLYSYGTVTEGVVRPSLASMIAEKPGNIGESFLIDQSIDPRSIPRLSFSDLISGKQLPVDLSGKKVLIGATAIELGDRYPISRFGVVPGVVIQAMATETLIQGTNLRSLGGLPSLILAAAIIFACIITKKATPTMITRVAMAIGLALIGSLLLAEYFHVTTFLNMSAFFFLFCYAVLQKVILTTKDLDSSRYVSSISGLPNEAALAKALDGREFGYIATARIADFRELLVVTDKNSRRDLFQNFAKRLSFLAEDDRIFHIDSDFVAWIVKSDYRVDIPGHFDTASALLQSPLMAENARIRINATFGVSGESIDKARIAAEQAYSSSKRWAWHDQEVDVAIGQKYNILTELDQAIEDGNLMVAYQPQWDLKAHCLEGAEALVRWNLSDGSRLSPEIFIPMLEKAGRIDQLTFLVLRRVLADLTIWDRKRPGLTCAVNISAALLSDSNFVEEAIALVKDADIRNDQIVFEVTETANLADMEVSVNSLELIRKSGIKVSIDDYGTGQATMTYLQRLPISEVKLDKSFVKTIVTDKANQVMVKSTIAMAHDLGLTVVAEGIEDQACMDMLSQYGCDIGQGWHISKPVSAKKFIAVWLDGKFEEERLSA